MTVNDFVNKLNEIGCTGDETLCVHAFGGLGASGQPVATVRHGFDWDRGKVIIHCERALQLYAKKDKANQT